MNEHVDELKKGYRDISAPPYLATRISAEVGDRSIRRRGLLPAGAAIMAVLVLALLLPYVAQRSATTPVLPDKPSLTALAALKPDKPAGMPTSLTRVRTIARPKMPSKPGPKAVEPQSGLETDTEMRKESEDALA